MNLTTKSFVSLSATTGTVSGSAHEKVPTIFGFTVQPDSVLSESF